MVRGCSSQLHFRIIWGFLKIILFIYLFLPMLSLRCPADFSLVAASGGYSDAGTSHCGGFSCCTSWLWSSGYMVEAHGLSCPVACGIVPDQGISEPVSPALASGFFTVESSRKPHQEKYFFKKSMCLGHMYAKK